MNSLKPKLKAMLGRLGQSAWLEPLLRRPAVKRFLCAIPGGRALYPSAWDRTHPYDRDHGTDTSGIVPVSELGVGAAELEGANCYGGSQPSVLRTVLSTLPALETCAFVDLGCGKGRPLFVAAEFPFREIVGVELSPLLAGVAERNAAIVRERNPGRVPVQIVTGDATAYRFPHGDIVLMLYNPFGQALIEKVVANVESALATQSRRFYVVYYNPVHGACFDASTKLRRRYARTLPYAMDEMGYGPDEADPVLIWEPADGQTVPGTDVSIFITVPGMRCELRDA